MRYSKPNEHGVFVGDELAENVEHTTPSGARITIPIALTAKGWYSSLCFDYFEGGKGGAPSVHSNAHPCRQAAIDEQLSCLSEICNGFLVAADERERRKTQASEALDWIASQQQGALF